MKKYILLVLLVINYQNSEAQFLTNSKFRIYRAESIFGAITQLRIESDGSFKIEIEEIHCSLCDQQELIKTINQSGEWNFNNDTIYLMNEVNRQRKLLVINDSTIKPLFIMGLDLSNVSDSTASILENGFLKSDFYLFHLIYDT